ncbi:MAG: DUF364 domain-containing protein [Thermoleophilia bacterium]|nr:DUF364 domain-containing protein [Thermoleophilia bacterium]
MKLIEDLLQSVADLDFEVKRVCIGLHWTAVESRFMGMAHTYKTNRKVEVAEAGDLVGRSALELAARMRSWEPLEASVGLAALNSLIEPSGSPGNVFEEILRMAPGKTVTIIGRFPSNEQVVSLAGKAYLLEMEPERGELPPSAAEEVVPQSDVTVISATALINKTLPRLLDLGRQGTTVVLGPSTPMNDVLFDHGATILAGTRVANADALVSSIMQGAKSFNRLAGIEPLVSSRR